MKRVTVITTLIIVLVSVISSYAQEVNKYNNIWEGNLEAGSKKIKIIFKTIKDAEGNFSGFLDSPDQGARDIPVTKILLTKDSLKFEIANLGAKYSGKFETDGATVNGKFKQGPMDLDLTFKKIDKIEEPKRPQLPVKPYLYNEEELTFFNKEAGITLAGTLTFPKGAGKFPAVVMVTGSGPQDRDESLFGHKPFLVVADYLTRNGIAVLRFDDRGVGKSTGNFSTALTTDFVTDAIAAIDYLRTRKEIDQNKIGIVGHSEGGLVAPLAATNSDNVKFIVMLAGPGMIGKDLIPLQTKLLLKAGGASDKEVEDQFKTMTESFNIIIGSQDSISAYKNLKYKFEEKLSKMNEEEKKKPENSIEAFNGMTKQMLSPWFRFFLKYDPSPALENVSIPVLAMNGEKDLQVPSKENLSLVEKALKAGGNTKYKIVSLPGLNHLFQTANTGSGSEYGQIEETFSPNALKIIVDWISEVTQKM